jgi:hypothetical protein
MFQMPSWQAGAPDDPGRMVTDIAANAIRIPGTPSRLVFAADVAVEAELERDARIAAIVRRSLTSAISERWRSKGAATLVAMISGVAPGASTMIIGRSTCGSIDTGTRTTQQSPQALPRTSAPLL